MKVFFGAAHNVTAQITDYANDVVPWSKVEIVVEEAIPRYGAKLGRGKVELYMEDMLHARRLVDAINAAAPRLPVDEGVA